MNSPVLPVFPVAKNTSGNFSKKPVQDLILTGHPS